MSSFALSLIIDHPARANCWRKNLQLVKLKSCYILTYPNISNYILLYQTISYYTILYRSFQTIPNYTLLYPTIPNHSQLYPTLPNYIQLYPTLSYNTQLYPTIYYNTQLCIVGYTLPASINCKRVKLKSCPHVLLLLLLLMRMPKIGILKLLFVLFVADSTLHALCVDGLQISTNLDTIGFHVSPLCRSLHSECWLGFT